MPQAERGDVDVNWPRIEPLRAVLAMLEQRRAKPGGALVRVSTHHAYHAEPSKLAAASEHLNWYGTRGTRARTGHAPHAARASVPARARTDALVPTAVRPRGRVGSQWPGRACAYRPGMRGRTGHAPHAARANVPGMDALVRTAARPRAGARASNGRAGRARTGHAPHAYELGYFDRRGWNMILCGGASFQILIYGTENLLSTALRQHRLSIKKHTYVI